MQLNKLLFSIKNNDNHKIITICGIKLKFQRKTKFIQQEYPSLNDIKTTVNSIIINSRLEKYRGINYGKEIVIVGCGESCNYYIPKQNTIHIGINRAFKREDIAFDYLFVQDQFPEEMTSFINYKGNDCKKFIGIIPYSIDYRIHPCVINQINGERYVLNNTKMTNCPYDITMEPFADLMGTVFSALQFALFTLPKRIYLVGFDCNVGHAFKSDTKTDLSYQYNSWKMMKDYINKYWNCIEIISINPVGLKGMFKDQYSQNYIDSHNDVQIENHEIIKL